jgi:transcription elongation factor Elf1
MCLKMSKDIIVCPVCGSTDVVLDENMKFKCQKCGFTWGWEIHEPSQYPEEYPDEYYPDDYEREDEEYDYPDSEDGWTEEEEFWFE